MSIFFDEDKALTPKADESWSRGPRTSISENFSAVSKAFGMTEWSHSEIMNLQEEYGNVVQLLHENGNSNFTSPVDFESIMGGSKYQDNEDVAVVGYRQVANTGDLVQTQANFWKQVEEVKKANPEIALKLTEAGLDTHENMQKVIAKKAHDAWQDYAEIKSRSTTLSNIVGGFGGMAVSSFKDPYMMLGVGASFGYAIPATFGKAAWKIARYEAIIGGVSEAMIQLKSQPYRKELGFEDAGLETGLKNIFMVAGASATLSPLLFGVFKAFGKGVDVGKKHLFKLSDEELQAVGKEMGDLNPKYKNTALDNYKIPEKDNPFPDNAAGRTEHRERLDAAAKSMNESTELDLPPAKNPIDTDNLRPPVNVKPGELIDIFDAKGNKVNVPVIIKSSSGNSLKVKMPDGSERVISLDPKSSAFLNVRNPNYTIKSAGLNAQGKTVSQLSKQEINTIRNKLIERKAELEKSGNTDQGVYADTLQDLNSLDFNVPKIATEANAPGINKANFNRNESTIAQDIEAAKNFDVPNEAAYRNQASLSEETMFDAGTSAAIRAEAEAGAAAKTVPIDNPLAKTQDLVSKSQETDTALSSTVLATAQSKPPLIRGLANKSVGDFNSIGIRLYQKSNDYKEIYSNLSKKLEPLKKDLQEITAKYDGDLKARVKDEAKIKEKLAVKKDLQPQNIPDWLGARISVDTITQAKLLLSELNKTYKLLEIDDFLDDVARTQRKTPTEYRRIHTQALTKDGFSFELQISLKELDPIIDKSHAVYKKIRYQRDSMSMDEWNKTLKEQAKVEADMKNAYFKIKDKEFSRMNTTNDVDIPFVIGTRLDENGDIVPLLSTARETFEQDAKAATMFKRLENCV